MPFVIPVLFSIYFVGVRWIGHTERTDLNALLLLAEKRVKEGDILEYLEVDREMAYPGGRSV